MLIRTEELKYKCSHVFMLLSLAFLYMDTNYVILKLKFEILEGKLLNTALYRCRSYVSFNFFGTTLLFKKRQFKFSVFVLLLLLLLCMVITLKICVCKCIMCMIHLLHTVEYLTCTCFL